MIASNEWSFRERQFEKTPELSIGSVRIFSSSPVASSQARNFNQKAATCTRRREGRPKRSDKRKFDVACAHNRIYLLHGCEPVRSAKES